MTLKLKKFLSDFIEIMKEDFPLQLRGIVKDARGITCLQTLDNEKAVIQTRKREIIITKGAPKNEINARVVLSRDCLFKIIEGKLTLAEAFYTKEFDVIGDPQTLLRCYEMWIRIISIARTSPRFHFLIYKLR
jgi:putative sterol carrier protein